MNNEAATSKSINGALNQKLDLNIGRSNSCANITAGNRNHKKLLLIKQKLAPDWKNIFRQILNVYDTNNEGNIKAKDFEECVHNLGAKFMSRGDLNLLYKNFGQGIDGYEIPNEKIDLNSVRFDYLEMCSSLGLDNNKIRVMVN